MDDKVRTTIYLNKEVHCYLKENDFNISKLVEQFLVFYCKLPDSIQSDKKKAFEEYETQNKQEQERLKKETTKVILDNVRWIKKYHTNGYSRTLAKQISDYVFDKTDTRPDLSLVKEQLDLALKLITEKYGNDVTIAIGKYEVWQENQRDRALNRNRY